MIFAPLSRNLLASATNTQSASLFELGMGISRLTDPDPSLQTRWRGTITVTAGVNDKIDFNDGGVRAATVTPGTYACPQDAFAAGASAMTAVSGGGGGPAWTAYQMHEAVNSYHYRSRFVRASGTAYLLGATGANAATSFMTLCAGFAPIDTIIAVGTHTSNFVAGATDSNALYDLTSTQLTADVTFLANLDVGAGATIIVGAGATSAATNVRYLAGDAIDTRCMCLVYPSPIEYRYAKLTIDTSRRRDRLRPALGYWYHGPAIDTRGRMHATVNWMPGGSTMSLVQRSVLKSTKDARPAVAEIRPGQRFSVAVESFDPVSYQELLGMVDAVAQDSRVFVALDPDNEPHRMSALCRVEGRPQWSGALVQSGHGRRKVEIVFRAEDW